MILEAIDSEVKEAMREKNFNKANALRYIKNALKNEAINKKRDLTNNEVVQILQKEAKKRRDSIAQFEQGGRSDLAKKEEEELTLLEKYLPQPLLDKEIYQIVTKAIANLGATSIKDMGRVMAEVMPKFAGRADGSQVSTLIREKLQ